MAFLPEVCNHNPSSSQIPELCNHNMDCIFDVIDEMQRGICGRVFDSKTGTRLHGRIQAKGSYSAVFSHPASGAYYKYITSPSGDYEVTAFANGYKPLTKTVQAVSNNFATLDFPLEFDHELEYCALSVDAILAYNSPSHSDIYKCLEAPDNSTFTLEGGSDPKGFINLDLGPATPVTNKNGDDLTVFATNNTTYTVSAAYDINNIDENANKLGTGQGEASFDLESAGLDSARFIQISLTSGSVEIDAVEVEPREVVIGINNKSASQSSFKNPTILHVNGKSGIILQAYIPKGLYKISAYDLMGRNIYTLDNGEAITSAQKTFHWNGITKNGNSCAEGAYMFYIVTSAGTKVVKGMLLK